ncbi:MAG TPA: Cro/Cl family transcriptional regulator, partial [Desulfocapsa sulfexigens]|nr:Cro/Cl family transcriptional regulator [Desulfocapsa sulfexigens]
MNKYLTSSEIIDWKNIDVTVKARELSQGMISPVDIAKACFMYVRDEIK